MRPARSALKQKRSYYSEKEGDAGDRSEHKNANTPKPKKKGVRFDKVHIRSHMRALGASGGVPQRGGIALGITDVYRQEPPLPVESWEVSQFSTTPISIYSPRTSNQKNGKIGTYPYNQELPS